MKQTGSPLWPHGQAVKTSPFHGGNPGSIPGGVTSKPVNFTFAGFFFFAEQSRIVIEMLLSKYLKIIGNLTHNQMTAKKNHFIIIQEGIIIKQFFFCYRLRRKISFDFYSFGLREEEG